MSQSKATTEFIYEPVQAGLAEVEARLKGLAGGGHQQLAQLLGHLTKSPGKRVRPAITLLASRFHSDEGGDSPVIMAAAVELLHMASLVHDDTVDDSPVRRGVATVSSLWGNNVAVLLGDYVFATSGVFVCETGNMRVIRRFSETIMELSTGELMETFGAFKLDCTYEQYKERIYNKTASLFRTAAESGAILSGAPETVIHSLTQYGYNLGMAFQIVDDILDFEGTQEEVGKPVGHDLLQGTLTLPSMLLLERYPDNNPVVDLFQGKEPDNNRRRALEMIHDSTIIQDCYGVARGFHESAATVLKQLPDTRERRSLEELLDYVVVRRQ